MTVIVTRDVPDRFRGFLASCALEIAPGVYTAPRMSSAVRERLWEVLTDWHRVLKQGAVIMTWSDTAHPAGQQIATLGFPPREIVNLYGVFVVRHERLDLPNSSGATK